MAVLTNQIYWSRIILVTWLWRLETISRIRSHCLTRVPAARPSEIRGPEQSGCGHQLPFRTLYGMACHWWPDSQRNNIFLESSL